MLFALAGFLAAQIVAGGQQAVPRFEPADCPFSPPASVARPECGWLIVPEVHVAPNERTFRLAVAIYRARERSEALPLLLLHGGPGGHTRAAIVRKHLSTSNLVDIFRRERKPDDL